MKNIFIAITVFLVLSSGASIAQAQTSSDVRNSLIYKLQKGIYNRAVKYNDFNMAINALYNLCVLEPQNDSLLAALEYLYFNNRNYISAVLVANDALLLNPNHTGSQEIKAVALEEIGARDKALEEYESLYLKHSNSIQYLFKMTVLQVDLKRYKEAKTNADILLSKKTIDSLEIDMPKGENETQPVSMKACLYNLKGLIEQGQGNNDEAKKQFDAALQMNPDFYLARQNLDAMLKSEK